MGLFFMSRASQSLKWTVSALTYHPVVPETVGSQFHIRVGDIWRAGPIEPVPQNTRSVASVPTRKAIGNGTNIGWMGWPLIDAVLGAPLLKSSAMMRRHPEMKPLL
jgi:hypothetical protein